MATSWRHRTKVPLLENTDSFMLILRSPLSLCRKTQVEMSEQGHNQKMKQAEEHDPVCGMKVDPSKAAASVEHEGAKIYFCSQGCAAKFRAAPEKYAQAKAISPASHLPAKTEPQGEYTCPMHPEVKQTGPGSCPKCGMALEPAAAPAPAKRSEYTCPMHPQIVRDGPGSCPICGMALEPREVTAEDSNPELVNMTRRLWISVALAVPMLALMVSAFLPSMPMQHVFSAKVWAWIECALATPAVNLVRIAVFCQGLAIHRASQPQHVYAYISWNWFGLPLQRLRNRCSSDISSVVSWGRRTDPGEKAVIRIKVATNVLGCFPLKYTGLSTLHAILRNRVWPGSVAILDFL